MKKNQSSEDKERRSKLLILLLLLLCFIATGVSVWALFFREPDITLAPDYAPQEQEEHAETIPDDTGDKMETPQGGGAVSLTYANQVGIDLSAGTVSLLFANPGKSNQDMVIQVVIQDQVIAQSGTISPGYRVMNLDLLEGAVKMLSTGGYDGKFVVLYYNQETGEKAIINTEIPIQITVTE